MAIEKIILDFDHTLFDADDFKVALASSLRSLGVTDELFWGTYRHARDMADGGLNYRLEKHVDLINERQPLDKEAALRNLQEVVKRSEDFLYPDAKEFLGRLISLGLPTVLLTRGDPEFQHQKISASGIDKLVNQVIATERKKSDVVRELRHDGEHTTYFVDDHFDETLDVIAANPTVVPILKRRPDQPPERYLGVRMLNFRTLSEIRDYLTIVHATHPRYEE